ncbi:Uncharacterised protein [Burkholderia pseudomallei]|nr:Uncharacterised protein [Burkholderia pseudomallei]
MRRHARDGHRRRWPSAGGLRSRKTRGVNSSVEQNGPDAADDRYGRVRRPVVAPMRAPATRRDRRSAPGADARRRPARTSTLRDSPHRLRLEPRGFSFIRRIPCRAAIARGRGTDARRSLRIAFFRRASSVQPAGLRSCSRLGRRRAGLAGLHNLKKEWPTRRSGHRPIGTGCAALGIRFGALVTRLSEDRLTHHERCGRATDSGGNAHAG